MKKIFVFGASGGTGKNIVEQALKAGYEVTALLRNPDAFSIHHRNLQVIKGDVLQPITFKKEISGFDAVISCLGIPKIQETTLYSVGVNNIVQAMQESGIDRVMCISSGALDIPPGSSFIMKFLLKNVLQRLYRPVYSDMRLMENTLVNSGMNWTIVRAPKLTDGQLTGKYKNITGKGLRGVPKISRADLANYMLDHLFDPKTFKNRIDVAS